MSPLRSNFASGLIQLSFWGGRRSQGLKAGEGLLKFTPQEAAGHSEPHQKLKPRSLAD